MRLKLCFGVMLQLSISEGIHLRGNSTFIVYAHEIERGTNRDLISVYHFASLRRVWDVL